MVAGWKLPSKYLYSCVMKADTSSRQIATATGKAGERVFTVVDVENVDPLSPRDSVKTFILSGKPKVVYCDIVIAGGGMGGIGAAIRAAKHDLKVCVTEETGWIGGQMTAQAVSAPDENRFVETSGATRIYQELRNAIREHYQRCPGASEQSAHDDRLNPGNCWVSWLSFEPQLGLSKLDDVIAKHTAQSSLKFFRRTKVVEVRLQGGRAKALLAVNLDTGKFVEIRARFVIDATELGDLLPLAGVPYASGAESRVDTGEAHAPLAANPDNVQDFTYPFVIDIAGGTNVIPKPPKYEQFNSAGKFSFMGYRMFENAPIAGTDRHYLPFWTYRRLIAKENFPDGSYQSDLSMINWESNDLRGENIIDVPAQLQAERLADGKLVSLGFLYWLQTEAPRDDGGKGYPEFRLRPDVTGTKDGLSKYPYIRESRRIKAKKTIVEEEIAAATNTGARATLFNDSLGIGLYPIDIHGHQDVPGAGQASKPFQIPLGALVQTSVRNFLPACKNIGTTHVTNGAYRLHPVEWAIGEAAGEVAVFCLQQRTKPESVRKNLLKLRTVQHRLLEHGAPLFWFDDIDTSDPDFVAIQFSALTGLIGIAVDSLSFQPDSQVTEEEVQSALKLLRRKGAVSAEEGSMSLTTRREFARRVYQMALNKRVFGRF